MAARIDEEERQENARLRSQFTKERYTLDNLDAYLQALWDQLSAGLRANRDLWLVMLESGDCVNAFIERRKADLERAELLTWSELPG